MIKKLLSYLYSSFDKDPQETLALRIRHERVAVWSVSDRTLTVGTRLNAVTNVYDLTTLTIGQLADEISQAGFSVVFKNDALSRFNASILIDSSGAEDRSNGDHMYAYQSPLWMILDVYAKILSETYENTVLNAVQMAYFEKAEGFWLDQWGVYFSIVRDRGESDDDYRNRIIEEVTRSRSNRYSIQNTIKEKTGINIVIHELWEDIFTLDLSLLSGGDSFQDGFYYTWGTIEAICYDELTEEQIKEIEGIINRERLAGILFEGINFAKNAIASRDIELKTIFDYESKKATWRTKRTWTGTWKDFVISGFIVSMRLS